MGLNDASVYWIVFTVICVLFVYAIPYIAFFTYHLVSYLFDKFVDYCSKVIRWLNEVTGW